MSDLSKAKPTRVEQRIERAVMQACMHPALQHPIRYAIDYPRSLLLLVLLSLTTLAMWSTYIREPIHAFAPQEAAITIQLAGH